MSLSPDFDNEINSLTREFTKQQPSDVLQFCANHFLRRLEAQRAEYHLSTTHSSQKGTPAMAESNFPGTNPFGASAGVQTTDRGMQRLEEEEEDEHDHMGSPNSPTFKTDSFGGVAPKTSAPPAASSTFSTPTFGQGGFGSGGFGSSGFMAGNRLPPMDGANLPSNYNFNRRVSVSAESMNPADTASDNWSPPVHPKTDDQQARLRKAVAQNFIFSHLDDDQTTQVLGALNEKVIPAKGIKVITQGDVGDYFYVVEKGTFDVYVSSTGKLETGVDGAGKKVNTISSGGSFGELALMYNAPRAATVMSTEQSTLWALDRVTFRRILMDSAFQRRKMYEAFLAEVPILESLTNYERSKVADALRTEKFPAGHKIIAEGDPGEDFFLLESGSAEVFKRGTDAAVHKYSKGDYFGELALLDDKPRAASVIASTEVKVAALGKDGFQRLLGPVEQLMRRNDPSKHDENGLESH